MRQYNAILRKQEIDAIGVFPIQTIYLISFNLYSWIERDFPESNALDSQKHTMTTQKWLEVYVNALGIYPTA